MAIIPIKPEGQTRYRPLGEVLEGWKRKRMKCSKVPISPFRLGLTHSLIDLSTLQVISVESDSKRPTWCTQIWRSVTIWNGRGKTQLVGVVAKVRLRHNMLNTHCMDYCIDLSEPTIWATLPKESARWRVHRHDAGIKPVEAHRHLSTNDQSL